MGCPFFEAGAVKQEQQNKETGKKTGGTRSERKFFRVDAHVHLLCGLVPHEERAGIGSRTMPKTSGISWEAETLKKVDISGAGIAFNSDEFYAVGDIVALKIMFKKDWGTPLLVYGEVVRVEPYSNYCRIALRYVALDERIRSIIMRFVFERERDIIAEKRVGWL